MNSRLPDNLRRKLDGISSRFPTRATIEDSACRVLLRLPEYRPRQEFLRWAADLRSRNAPPPLAKHSIRARWGESRARMEFILTDQCQDYPY